MNELPPHPASPRNPWTRPSSVSSKSLDGLVTKCHSPHTTVVLATEAFSTWFEELHQKDARAVARVVGLLEAKGATLGFPYSSAIEGSRQALRELRAQSNGRPLRVLYAFDPKRQAVLLLGGDKTGDDRFYRRLVPQAESLWSQYLDELKEEAKP